MDKIFLCLLTCSWCFGLFGNHIYVNDVLLTGQDQTTGSVMVEFDISWQNSWRISTGPANWDAAWVFIKFRANGGVWQHATLNYVDGTAANDGHTQVLNSTINTSPDGKGVFIYRSADFIGNVIYPNTQLRWNYSADGVNASDLLEVRVYAIEMVYVPQGAFELGSGGAENSHFFKYQLISTSQPPYPILNENQITVGPTLGDLYYQNSSGQAGDQSGPIPATFPKGFNGFYCMKYECSQEQWVEFFNTLTPAQQTVHDITDASHKGSDSEVMRNTISFTTGQATVAIPDRACNFITNSDYLAYLDWAALRPMTELEYEKACRGTLAAVADEYPWGNTNLAINSYILWDDQFSHAFIRNLPIQTGNAFYQITTGGILGPLRCGIVSGSLFNSPGALYTREETGGSFYGVMELAGNLSERCVNVGSPEGRAYTGLHGDGALNIFGWADVPNWPVNAGLGSRGGGWNDIAARMAVSSRYSAGENLSSAGIAVGIRGVRTAN